MAVVAEKLIRALVTFDLPILYPKFICFEADDDDLFSTYMLYFLSFQ